MLRCKAFNPGPFNVDPFKFVVYWPADSVCEFVDVKAGVERAKKKKEEKARRALEESTRKKQQEQSAAAAPKVDLSGPDARAKEVKKLKKKLGQVQKLRDLEAAGTELDEAQSKKLATGPGLEKEIAALEKASAYEFKELQQGRLFISEIAA